MHGIILPRSIIVDSILLLDGLLGHDMITGRRQAHIIHLDKMQPIETEAVDQGLEMMGDQM